MRYTANIEMKNGMNTLFNTFTIEARGKADALDKTLTIMNTLDGDFSSLNIVAQGSYKDDENKDE